MKKRPTMLASMQRRLLVFYAWDADDDHADDHFVACRVCALSRNDLGAGGPRFFVYLCVHADESTPLLVFHFAARRCRLERKDRTADQK